MCDLTVVGIYLPRLDLPRLRRYVLDDKKRFTDVAVPELRAQGFLRNMSDEEVLVRADEIAEDTERELERAALFELEVRMKDSFDLSSIIEAWEPCYLTPDGESTLEGLGLSPSTATAYRVAFWVHDWHEGKKLTGLDQMLSFPTPEPVPERLWKLAPYALVD